MKEKHQIDGGRPSGGAGRERTGTGTQEALAESVVLCSLKKTTFEQT